MIISCGKNEEKMHYSDNTVKNGIIGVLGRPLGTIIEIEGQLDPGEGAKADMDKILFRVQKLDGEELDRTIVLPVETFSWMSVASPGEGEIVKYLGYETGGMSGIPEEAFAHMPYVTTTAYHFSLYFQIIKRLD